MLSLILCLFQYDDDEYDHKRMSKGITEDIFSFLIFLINF